ncbi:DNA-binding FadR family transcriptional regulator [Alteromonadaceae bacterium 2753L.S.0a.02]|nr:DNA-binding FadR family transcriptional regulator [Alteromonadaceae bacterium 2753L.S.0a.02]
MLDRNHNLSFRMTQLLGQAIVCEEYQPEDSLPTEAELCEKFGVSRTAVREAVKMLSAKGLICSKPRQGIRIQPKDEWNILDSDVLSWMLEGKPTLEVLREFLQMRIAVEPEAAALGARINRSGRIAAIGDALDRMRCHKAGSEEASEADLDFHIAILYASENRFYIRMRDLVRTALKVSISFTTEIKGDYEAIVEDHAKVYNAIRNGQPERAKNAMFLLIDEALEFIEREIEHQNA